MSQGILSDEDPLMLFGMSDRTFCTFVRISNPFGILDVRFQN